MTLLQKLKDKNLEARKSRNMFAVNVLTPLIGDAEMVGKNASRDVTDAEVVQVVKKFIKGLDETMRVLDTLDPRWKLASFEKDILEQFLPKQLSTSELERILASIKTEIEAGPKDMGKMLALLKSRFDGQYDGKIASMIAKSLLA